MASRKGFFVKPSSIFDTTSSNTHFHLDSAEGVSAFYEAELWRLPSNANLVTEARREVDAGGRRRSSATSGSLPVNIPDWSKILKGNRKRESVEDDDGEIRVPPHEYLARTRGASLSVQEGLGRTLKGRDLRNVRNAIWKKVGFED